MESSNSLGKVSIKEGTDFSLNWSDKKGNCFANDLVNKAYTYDKSSNSVFHYMKRRLDELYYGFGEKAGCLNKQGKCLFLSQFKIILLRIENENAEFGPIGVLNPLFHPVLYVNR
jgi:alpha-glucosidase (family GH31 glycosyl hydrolase)